MKDNLSVDKNNLMDSTASKIQQLQKAFAELESHRAVTLNVKWKQLEEHFHGLQKSLKRRFTDLEDQEKGFETKIIESKEFLEKRRAAVYAKEQVSLERLQEKRDAAVAAILNAMEKRDNPFAVNSGPVDEENLVEEPQVVEEKPVNVINEQVKSYPELVKLCQEMNSEGLHKFISDNRKNLAILREEIPIALKAAGDPASLVLDSLKGFYALDTPNSDAKKDSNLLGIRRTCIMLLECLGTLLNLDSGSRSVHVSENAKERAKAVAEEWKPKLDYLDVDASNGNSLEAHAFLQVLATFGINSDFDQESLSKLIPMVSRRRQTAELCRYLGLSDKMPGVIDVLVKNGRHIDAVNLAFGFELTDQFSPVSLLKSYLSEAKKVSSPAKPGNMSPASASSQTDVNEKELTALKAVIKCIEDHKLEEQFPVDPLQKQVLEIEKAKAGKKRATEVAKPHKRARANVVAHPQPQRVANVTHDNNNFYGNRYPQYRYDRPYAYPGPMDHHIQSYPPATAAYSFTPSHGNFFGNGYQYQAAAYLH